MATPALQAAAVSAPRGAPRGKCTVVDLAKIPAEAGGAEALCAAVERAVASQAPGVPFTTEVKVISDSRMTAVLIVNGKVLPKLNFAVMDRQLNKRSIERFAAAIAAKVAKAATQ